MIFVRRCTILDIPECLEIARECYAAFDEQKARAWAETAMLKPDVAFFRTDDVWGAVSMATLFYEPGPRAVMAFLAGRHSKAWQACAVLRAVLNWAHEKKAASFSFGEDTGMRMDVLAKRIGATQDRPTYRVELIPSTRTSVPQPPSFLSTFWSRAA